jgi:membrane protein implicated in regulation of membrane protease activity
MTNAPRESTARVALRYLLFQMPGWFVAAGVLALAVDLFGVAGWLALAAFALFVAKDAVLFPFVRRAYERNHVPPHPVGETGVAEDAIDAGEGWVRVGRELWRARRAPGAAAIARGERVRVVGLRGHVLEVEAFAVEAAPSPLP